MPQAEDSSYEEVAPQTENSGGAKINTGEYASAASVSNVPSRTSKAQRGPMSEESFRAALLKPLSGEEVAVKMSELNKNEIEINSSTISLEEFQVYDEWRKKQHFNFMGAVGDGVIQTVKDVGGGLISAATDWKKLALGTGISLATGNPLLGFGIAYGSSLAEGFARGTRDLGGLAVMAANHPDSPIYRMFVNPSNDVNQSYEDFLTLARWNARSEQILNGKANAFMPERETYEKLFGKAFGGQIDDFIGVNRELATASSYILDPTLFLTMGGSSAGKAGAKAIADATAAAALKTGNAGSAVATAVAARASRNAVKSRFLESVGLNMSKFSDAITKPMEAGYNKVEQMLSNAIGGPVNIRGKSARTTRPAVGHAPTSLTHAVIGSIGAYSLFSIPYAIPIASVYAGLKGIGIVGEKLAAHGGMKVGAAAGDAIGKRLANSGALSIYMKDVSKTMLHGSLYGGVIGGIAGGEEGAAGGIGTGIALGAIGHNAALLEGTVSGKFAKISTMKEWEAHHKDLKDANHILKSQRMNEFIKDIQRDHGEDAGLRLMSQMLTLEKSENTAVTYMTYEDIVKLLHTDTKFFTVDPATGKKTYNANGIEFEKAITAKEAGGQGWNGMFVKHDAEGKEHAHGFHMFTDGESKQTHVIINIDNYRMLKDDMGNLVKRKKMGFLRDENGNLITHQVTEEFETSRTVMETIDIPRFETIETKVEGERTNVNVFPAEIAKGTSETTQYGIPLKGRLAREVAQPKVSQPMIGPMPPVSKFEGRRVVDKLPYPKKETVTGTRPVTKPLVGEVMAPIAIRSETAPLGELYHAMNYIQRKAGYGQDIVSNVKNWLTGKVESGGAFVDRAATVKFMNQAYDKLVGVRRNTQTALDWKQAIDGYEKTGEITPEVSSAFDVFAEELGEAMFLGWESGKPFDYILRGGDLGFVRNLVEGIKDEFAKRSLTTATNYGADVNTKESFLAWFKKNKDGGKFRFDKGMEQAFTDLVRVYSQEGMKDANHRRVDISALQGASLLAHARQYGYEDRLNVSDDGQTVTIKPDEQYNKEMATKGNALVLELAEMADRNAADANGLDFYVTDKEPAPYDGIRTHDDGTLDSIAGRNANAAGNAGGFLFQSPDFQDMGVGLDDIVANQIAKAKRDGLYGNRTSNFFGARGRPRTTPSGKLGVQMREAMQNGHTLIFRGIPTEAAFKIIEKHIPKHVAQNVRRLAPIIVDGGISQPNVLKAYYHGFEHHDIDGTKLTRGKHHFEPRLLSFVPYDMEFRITLKNGKHPEKPYTKEHFTFNVNGADVDALNRRMHKIWNNSPELQKQYDHIQQFMEHVFETVDHYSGTGTIPATKFFGDTAEARTRRKYVCAAIGAVPNKEVKGKYSVPSVEWHDAQFRDRGAEQDSVWGKFSLANLSSVEAHSGERMRMRLNEKTYRRAMVPTPVSDTARERSGASMFRERDGSERMYQAPDYEGRDDYWRGQTQKDPFVSLDESGLKIRKASAIIDGEARFLPQEQGAITWSQIGHGWGFTDTITGNEMPSERPSNKKQGLWYASADSFNEPAGKVIKGDVENYDTHEDWFSELIKSRKYTPYSFKGRIDLPLYRNGELIHRGRMSIADNVEGGVGEDAYHRNININDVKKMKEKVASQYGIKVEDIDAYYFGRKDDVRNQFGYSNKDRLPIMFQNPEDGMMHPDDEIPVAMNDIRTHHRLTSSDEFKGEKAKRDINNTSALLKKLDGMVEFQQKRKNEVFFQPAETYGAKNQAEAEFLKSNYKWAIEQGDVYLSEALIRFERFLERNSGKTVTNVRYSLDEFMAAGGSMDQYNTRFKTGEPVMVVGTHGTPSIELLRTRTYSTEKLGGNTSAESAGRGTFHSGRQSTSHTYGLDPVKEKNDLLMALAGVPMAEFFDPTFKEYWPKDRDGRMRLVLNSIQAIKSTPETNILKQKAYDLVKKMFLDVERVGSVTEKWSNALTNNLERNRYFFDYLEKTFPRYDEVVLQNLQGEYKTKIQSNVSRAIVALKQQTQNKPIKQVAAQLQTMIEVNDIPKDVGRKLQVEVNKEIERQAQGFDLETLQEEYRMSMQDQLELTNKIKDSKSKIRALFEDTFKQMQLSSTRQMRTIVGFANPLVYDFKGEMYREQTYASIMKQAKEAGHDGVILLNTFDGGIIVDNIYATLRGTEQTHLANIDTTISGESVPRNSGIKEGSTFFQSPDDVLPVGAFGPNNPHTVEISRGLKSKLGMTTGDGRFILKLNKDKSFKIGMAYDEMKHEPENPKVRAAFKAFADETLEQYNAIIEAGYKPEMHYSSEEPYGSSREVIKAIRETKSLKVLATDFNYGDRKVTPEDIKTNNLLAMSGFKDVNGKEMRINDIFRFVHDFFGHSERGNSFGELGEENAWDVHARMYSPLARRAMTSGTRGQNSWVNFVYEPNIQLNKQRAIVRKLREAGQKEQADALAATLGQTRFADQKIGLLPEWASKLDEEMSPMEKQIYGQHITSDGKFGLYQNPETGAESIGMPTPEQFVEWAKAARASTPWGSSVEVKDVNGYNGYELYAAGDGRAVLSISPDGELGSVVKGKHGNSHDVDALVRMALATGKVKWLNAFDTRLPDMYQAYGFEAVARLPFVDDFRPFDWDYEQYSKFNNGRPDVVFMAYVGDKARPYQEIKNLIPTVAEYDDAVAMTKQRNKASGGALFQNPDDISLDTIDFSIFDEKTQKDVDYMRRILDYANHVREIDAQVKAGNLQPHQKSVMLTKWFDKHFNETRVRESAYSWGEWYDAESKQKIKIADFTQQHLDNKVRARIKDEVIKLRRFTNDEPANIGKVKSLQKTRQRLLFSEKSKGRTWFESLSTKEQQALLNVFEREQERRQGVEQKELESMQAVEIDTTSEFIPESEGSRKMIKNPYLDMTQEEAMKAKFPKLTKEQAIAEAAIRAKLINDEIYIMGITDKPINWEVEDIDVIKKSLKERFADKEFSLSDDEIELMAIEEQQSQVRLKETTAAYESKRQPKADKIVAHVNVTTEFEGLIEGKGPSVGKLTEMAKKHVSTGWFDDNGPPNDKYRPLRWTYDGKEYTGTRASLPDGPKGKKELIRTEAVPVYPPEMQAIVDDVNQKLQSLRDNLNLEYNDRGVNVLLGLFQLWGWKLNSDIGDMSFQESFNPDIEGQIFESKKLENILRSRGDLVVGMEAQSSWTRNLDALPNFLETVEEVLNSAMRGVEFVHPKTGKVYDLKIGEGVKDNWAVEFAQAHPEFTEYLFYANAEDYVRDKMTTWKSNYKEKTYKPTPEQEPLVGVLTRKQLFEAAKKEAEARYHAEFAPNMKAINSFFRPLIDGKMDLDSNTYSVEKNIFKILDAKNSLVENKAQRLIKEQMHQAARSTAREIRRRFAEHIFELSKEVINDAAEKNELEIGATRKSPEVIQAERIKKRRKALDRAIGIDEAGNDITPEPVKPTPAPKPIAETPQAKPAQTPEPPKVAAQEVPAAVTEYKVNPKAYKKPIGPELPPPASGQTQYKKPIGPEQPKPVASEKFENVFRERADKKNFFYLKDKSGMVVKESDGSYSLYRGFEPLQQNKLWQYSNADELMAGYKQKLSTGLNAEVTTGTNKPKVTAQTALNVAILKEKQVEENIVKTPAQVATAEVVVRDAGLVASVASVNQDAVATVLAIKDNLTLVNVGKEKNRTIVSSDRRYIVNRKGNAFEVALQPHISPYHGQPVEGRTVAIVTSLEHAQLAIRDHDFLVRRLTEMEGINTSQSLQATAPPMNPIQIQQTVQAVVAQAQQNPAPKVTKPQVVAETHSSYADAVMALVKMKVSHADAKRIVKEFIDQKGMQVTLAEILTGGLTKLQEISAAIAEANTRFAAALQATQTQANPLDGANVTIMPSIGAVEAVAGQPIGRLPSIGLNGNSDITAFPKPNIWRPSLDQLQAFNTLCQFKQSTSRFAIGNGSLQNGKTYTNSLGDMIVQSGYGKYRVFAAGSILIGIVQSEQEAVDMLVRRRFKR